MNTSMRPKNYPYYHCSDNASTSASLTSGSSNSIVALDSLIIFSFTSLFPNNP